ncbi:MAG: hypothetical protein ACRCWF_09830 [Beijerinckiaceae bacterium]
MRAVVAFIVLLAGGAAACAQQAPQPKPQPMQIMVVRGAGEACEPNCPEWISAQGAITRDTPAQLQRVLATLRGRKLPVIIQSTGGHVDAGLRMGRMIRAAGLTAAVGSSTLPEPCKANDSACLRERRAKPVRGNFKLRRAYCASACTYMLAGGIRRIVHPDALLGVHRVKHTRTHHKIYRRYFVQKRMVNGRMVEVSRRLISEKTITGKTVTVDTGPEAAVNKTLERHFQTMGLAPEFHALTVATPADTLRYLTPGESRSHRIATDMTEFFSALGFDSTNPFFSTPSRPTAYLGYKPMGTYDGGNTMMEFFFDPTRGDHITINLMQGTKRLNSSHLRLSAFSRPDFVAIAVAEEQSPSGPLQFHLPHNAFCNLRPMHSLTVTIMAKEAGPTVAPLWTRSGTSADLLPLAGLQSAICTRKNWEP